MKALINNNVDWIGTTPNSWTKTPLRYVVINRDGGAWGEEEQNNENDRICIRIADFDYSKLNIASKEEYTIRNYTSRIIKKLTLRKNDILVEKSGGGDKVPVGRTVLWDKDFNALFANFIERIRLNEKKVFAKYIQYCLVSFYSQGFSRFYFNQTTGLQNLDITKWLRETKVPSPPINEQKRIANYLDKKCSEIDELADEIQKEIDKLEEYKRSVITEAVTRGINNDTQLKESGFEWLGKIPFHWSTGRIGGLYSVRITKVNDEDYPPLSVTKQGILPQMESVAKSNDHSNRKLVKKGDFAINSRSDRRNSCGISAYDGSVSLINTVLVPRENMNSKYYDWLFHTTEFADEFYKWGHGIVDDLWTTGWEDMKRINIPVPPLEEQIKIAEFLSHKCSRIEELIKIRKTQLEKLRDFKKSLIYEYVTGKKEVVFNG